ncbi:hypothetical protein [Kribbella sp. NPDC049584]|uniref:hypothetical protein n=1 Tax=Kribbella sp. NPDC049584 TaxID=3154833 RepID=UPI00344976CE
MKIDDLLGLDPDLRKHASLPEMDPLTEDDALQEAQVLDVRFDVIAGIAGILFELRQALQLQEATTGVLVAHGVRELSWRGPVRNRALTAWSVGSSVPRADNQLFSLNLVMWPHPGAQLSLTAETAAFFVGEVPGLSAAPPDYAGRDREAVVGEVASWGSIFEPVSAVFLDAAPIDG